MLIGENNIKSDRSGAVGRQLFYQSGVERTGPFPRVVRKVEGVSRCLIYAYNDDIRRGRSYSPQTE
jgi:hypothetical protein